MIVQVNGEVIGSTINDSIRSIDLLTPSGVAYRIIAPSREFSVKKGMSLTAYTSLQVREDSQTLYGFSDIEGRDFFEQIIGVSGIGPKIGLGLMSIYSVAEIKEFILTGDHKGLSKAPGVGPKGAKKIILDLTGVLTVQEDEDSVKQENQMISELKEALRTLGFKGEEQKKMVEVGREMLEKDHELTIEELLQKVLREG